MVSDDPWELNYYCKLCTRSFHDNRDLLLHKMHVHANDQQTAQIARRFTPWKIKPYVIQEEP